jgi:tetratricopeptide (TPR) repeat protein
MPGRIEKTVFISYRRTNLPWALCIYQSLTMHGYDVFFDYLSIDSGNFEKVILENIKARAHFLIILTPSALERCKEPDDWLRREIETAMDEKRNIVPLMLESFDFGSPLVRQALTGKLAALNQYNGLRVPSEYFLEAMDRLRDRYLNVVLGEIALPSLEIGTKEITETQKLAASEAAPVEPNQLTADEWFERGYVHEKDKNLDEAIRCYSEAIILEPTHFAAISGRGWAYQHNGDLAGALNDYNQLLNLRPDYANAYFLRGYIHRTQGDLDCAIRDFDKGIQLEPKDAGSYYDRGFTFEKTRKYAKAVEDYQRYLELGGGAQEGNQTEVEEKIKKLKNRLAMKNSRKKSSAKKTN